VKEYCELLEKIGARVLRLAPGPHDHLCAWVSHLPQMISTALAATRLLGYMLYEVSPRDPLSFACALLMITIASLAACLPPAWRATRTDPIRALRD